ncbi:hypothetical protein PoB_005476300 [Plakobranchus ocellatus]|uniref:Uncharacterized protein n=1 Tax=Plakobranchus ocellatus TaxID=259542 RepID=A0AAV4CB81_9GAST|nr:hypothetical protein PoB_005476300 [Plakobranchus ocellatus]
MPGIGNVRPTAWASKPLNEILWRQDRVAMSTAARQGCHEYGSKHGAGVPPANHTIAADQQVHNKVISDFRTPCQARPPSARDRLCHQTPSICVNCSFAP